MRSRYRDILKGLLVALLAVTTGCGGGSSGTGGQRYEGVLRTNALTPLPDVTVTLPQAGTATVTDASGNFAVDTQLSGGDVVFEFRGTDFEASAVVTGVSPTAVTVTITFEFDDDSKSVKPSSVSQRDDRDDDDAEDANDDHGDDDSGDDNHGGNSGSGGGEHEDDSSIDDDSEDDHGGNSGSGSNDSSGGEHEDESQSDLDGSDDHDSDNSGSGSEDPTDDHGGEGSGRDDS